MFSNVTSPDPLVDPIGAMSVFESLPPGQYKASLPFVITYVGEKRENTVGGVVGALKNGNEYQIVNGVAVYRPKDGGEGHWVIGVTGVSMEDFKKVIVDYAKVYFEKSFPYP
jgi:hypothetical protein